MARKLLTVSLKREKWEEKERWGRIPMHTILTKVIRSGDSIEVGFI